MEVALKTVETLLTMVVEKGGVPFDRIGLLELPGLINKTLSSNSKPLSKRYLYDTVFLSIQKAQKTASTYIQLERASLNTLSEYLGYKNIDEFRTIINPRMPQQAFALEGNWYSIVRCNSGLPYVMISPVKITASEEETQIILRGPHRFFKGKLSWLAGCISSVLTAEDGKMQHLVFRVGLSKKPKLLQGVFSGVSTSGVPIAGKGLLFRSYEKDFEGMNNYKLKIRENMDHSPTNIPGKLLHYFQNYNQTYLKIGDTSTFDIGDLY